MNIPTLRIIAGRLLLLGLCTAFLSACSSEKIIVAIDGGQGNADSVESSISVDGNYVAFTSRANNLVTDDTNLSTDVFVYDRNSGITERISVKSDGSQGNGDSSAPSISGNGRYVAFIAEASNLVFNDVNRTKDVFIHDRDTDITERISIASDGSQGDAASYQVALSTDGRYVAFTSLASNLVADDTNISADVFVHDRNTAITERISVASDGSQGDGYHPAISADGRFVAFTADSSNLVFNDSNGMSDIFVHDRNSHITELVSGSNDGSQGNLGAIFSAISADGRYVAFDSSSNNLVSEDTNAAEDVFVRDRKTGLTERVSIAIDGTQGNANSHIASISADGRYVVFQSLASTLISYDNNNFSDIFIHYRYVGITELVSITSNGGQGNSHSTRPAISADGNYVVFQSLASNLIQDDNNARSDIFFRKIN
ncbi:TolB family protein [Moritella dasanensis]|uniref:TolB family protein n=1 Tax=Moritella dasanensis TaxID=428031 RepID=UPI00037A78BC|nr:PD40 domain-containing protein [Moritella dasanensis]